MANQIISAAHNHIKRNGYWWMIPELSYAGWSADFICWGPNKGILEIERKDSWSDYRNDRNKSCSYNHKFALRDHSKRDIVRGLAEKYRVKVNGQHGQLRLSKNAHYHESGSWVDHKGWTPDGRMVCQINREINKYQWLLGKYPCEWRPTHFVYLAPMDLAVRIAADPDRPKQFGVWGAIQTSHSQWIKMLCPVRKLTNINPLYMSNFRKDAFTRALFFMDGWYAYKDTTMEGGEKDGRPNAITEGLGTTDIGCTG